MKSFVVCCRETPYRNLLSIARSREAQKEEKRSIALNLLQGGVVIEIITSVRGLSIEEVQQLQQQVSESAQR